MSDSEPTAGDFFTERVTYTGHVQGVGFRYSVRTIARRYPVAGYVKNLSDRSVELVVQGSRSAIDSLLADVAEQFRGNIRQCDRRSEDTAETYGGFDIRF